MKLSSIMLDALVDLDRLQERDQEASALKAKYADVESRLKKMLALFAGVLKRQPKGTLIEAHGLGIRLDDRGKLQVIRTVWADAVVVDQDLVEQLG